MSKGILSIFNILTILIIIFLMFICFKKKTKYKKNYILLMIFALASNLVYCIYLLSNNVKLISITLNFNFILESWILFIFLAFTNFYTGHTRDKIFSSALFVLILVDTALFIANIFTPIMVSFKEDQFNNSIYLYYEQKPLYIYHQIVAYFTFACSAGLLFRKIIESPTLFKNKYLAIFVVTVIAVVINTILYIFKYPVDFSILLYGVICIVIYFFGINFSPLLLKYSVEDIVVNEMDDYLIVYNYKNNFFYANSHCINLFSDSIKNLNYDQFINTYPEFSETSDKTKSVSINNKDMYFDIINKPILDSHGKLQFKIILLHDVTSGENEKILREYQRTHDPITDIFNRTYFIEKSNKIINRIQDNYYVIATDFSGFRLVNDFLGSNKGNEILIQTSNLLNSIFAKKRRIYARMEADKFAILVNKKDIDEGIIDLIYNTISASIKMLPLTLKLGVAEVINAEVVDAYDKCIMTIHFIKNEYERKYAFYDSGVAEKEIRAHLLLTSLDDSIKNNYFEIYYQPQVNSYDKTVVGAEALVRWNHPTLGRISPGEFIPIFEKNMVITSLDLFVWEEACKFLQKCQNTNLSKLSISINISPKDFYLIDVASKIISLVEKYKIKPKLLKLEITESAFVSDQKLLIKTITKLQNYGFIIEMDDFGSGYSSFNSLKDIPIDVLKLDMNFMDGDINKDKTIEILASIIGMAHRIHIPLIAEGVEEKNQVDFLHNLNLDIIQGYYFAKPMSHDDFLEYLRDKKVTSFIEFWTASDKNKEMFSTFKEIHQCFNQSPVSVLVLGPVYNSNNELKDMTIYYCNPAFLKNEGLIAEDISLKSIKIIYPLFNDKICKTFDDIIKNNSTKKIVTEYNGKHIHVYAYCLRKRYISLITTYLD